MALKHIDRYLFFPYRSQRLLTAACGIQSATRFQTSFLPASLASCGNAPVDIAAVSRYRTECLLQESRLIFIANPPLPPSKTDADALVQQAEQSFQRGKKFYQASDMASARREFDAAIDLMLEAADEIPANRRITRRRLEDMVDAIHRFDLTGMGASARRGRQVRKGAARRHSADDVSGGSQVERPRPRQVAATVSQLPLTVNDTVLGYINYFSNRGHKTIDRGHPAVGPLPSP